MAVYKVPQDVEADDKLIGPFSFRQFIFLLMMAGSLYFAYLFTRISLIIGFMPLPFTFIFAVLAFPWKKDQPTEVYLAALIHFWMKPRRRVWNPAGQLEHVKIDAPVVNEHKFTDGMTNVQVRSRLKTLATTLDSGGWSSKHTTMQAGVAPVDQTYQPAVLMSYGIPSDRLVAQPVYPMEVQDHAFDVGAENDVLDVDNNPVAQNFNNLVAASEQNRRALLMQQMQQAAQQYQQPSPAQPAQPFNAPIPPQPVNSGLNQTPSTQYQNGNTAYTDYNQNLPQQNTTQDLGTVQNSRIIDLANNTDLNVSTIARQAEQAMMHSGETIELHSENEN